MTEIYWLTRFDYINNFFTVMIIVGVITSMVLIIICSIMYLSEDFVPSKLKNISIYILIITIILSITSTFIPTTKDAYMIYGIGKSIDYLRENETVKQLPDKYINFIDKWVDENLKTEESCQKN